VGLCSVQAVPTAARKGGSSVARDDRRQAEAPVDAPRTSVRPPSGRARGGAAGHAATRSVIDVEPPDSERGDPPRGSRLAEFARSLRHPAFWAAVGSIATSIAVVITLVGLADARTQERFAQARRISAWLYGDQSEESGSGTLLNGSEQPVYGVVVWTVDIQGSGPRTGEEMMDSGDPEMMDSGDPEYQYVPTTIIALLPPGTYRTPLPPFQPGMGMRPGLEIAFTDAAGQSWIRRADGQLNEINEAPVDHYGLDPPFTFETLEVVTTPYRPV
jgi:hypothetical protein